MQWSWHFDLLMCKFHLYLFFNNLKNGCDRVDFWAVSLLGKCSNAVLKKYKSIIIFFYYLTKVWNYVEYHRFVYFRYHICIYILMNNKECEIEFSISFFLFFFWIFYFLSSLHPCFLCVYHWENNNFCCFNFLYL